MARRFWWRLAFAVIALSTAFAGFAAADGEPPLDTLVRATMQARGASPRIASDAQLCRRYSLDLTGVIPSAGDLAACAGATPDEMFAHFADKGPMPHTGGERPYVWVNVLKDADHFLFSNHTQFSQVRHVREMRDQLRRVYADGWSYAELARWALSSQFFLSRFPSGADRANASFFLFLGRNSMPNEVQAGNMWNGFVLRDDGIPESQAESNPDYHEYDFDDSECTSGRSLCVAELWGRSGDQPEEAIETMVGSRVFTEATVERYWGRYLGVKMPGVDYPDIRRSLVVGFEGSGYDVNWLIHEITTSIVYTQDARYR